MWYTEFKPSERRFFMRCKQEGEKMILIPKSGFKINRIAKLLIIFCILTMICLSLPLNSDNLPIFIAVAILWGMAIVLGVWMLVTNLGYRIVIDETGVREERVFLKKKCLSLSWNQIQDWGYSRFDQKSKSAYVLYFSDLPLSSDNGRKAVTKNCIRLVGEYRQIQTQMDTAVIPFCGGFSPVWPFRPIKTEL